IALAISYRSRYFISLSLFHIALAILFSKSEMLFTPKLLRVANKSSKTSFSVLAGGGEAADSGLFVS
ncbi:MAG: hypothetical protein AAB706_02150, partial [Patescibacteria group bacterium]